MTILLIFNLKNFFFRGFLRCFAKFNVWQLRENARHSEYHVHIYTINEDEDGDDKDNGNGGRYRRAKGGGDYS